MLYPNEALTRSAASLSVKTEKSSKVPEDELADHAPAGKIRPMERRGRHMPEWIAKENIKHFKKLLETERDPQKRSVIERELAEEEVKLAALKKQGDRKEG